MLPLLHFMFNAKKSEPNKLLHKLGSQTTN